MSLLRGFGGPGILFNGFGYSSFRVDIRKALYRFLKADETLAAIVDDRIYPEIRDPKSGLPAIVYHYHKGKRERFLDGSPKASKTSEIQFFFIATDPLEAIDLKAATDELIDGFRGYMAGLLVSASLSEEDDDDGIEKERDKEGNYVYWISTIYKFRYKAS